MTGMMLTWAAFSPLIVSLARRFRARHWRSIAAHIALFLTVFLVRLQATCGITVDAFFKAAWLLDGIIYCAIVAAVWLAEALIGMAGLRSNLQLLREQVTRVQLRLRRMHLPAEVILDTLAIIESRAADKDPRTRDLLVHFTALLRRLLDAVSRERWTVDEEIELVTLLLRLFRERSRSSVHLVVQGDTTQLNELIEPATLFAPVLARLTDASRVMVLVEPRTIRVEIETSSGQMIALDAVDTKAAAEDPQPFVSTTASAPSRAALFTALIGILAAAISILSIDQIMRTGVGQLAISLPVLRIGLWMAPLLLFIRGAKRPAWLLALAVTSAAAGETLFFAYIAATWPTYVPPFFSPAMARMIGSSLLLPSITTLAIGILLRARLMERDRLEQQVAMAEAHRQLAEARLELLQKQLQPHFLFNSLTSLSALLNSDVTRARSMMQRLRAYYARAASHAATMLVEMQREIDLVREYLDIEKVRFGERLTVHIDVDSDCNDVLVPPLLLQPLAENAIRHGVASNRGDGWVTVTVRRVSDSLNIAIRNNRGSSFPSALRPRLGLRNASERLQHTYGDRASILTDQEKPESFLVSIRIPASASLYS